MIMQNQELPNEASCGTTFSRTIPHFFTIILTQTLRANKLQIPKEIVRKCGDTLGDEVLLKVPLSREWKVGLSKSSDGKVWIQKGWLEFSKYYSLAHGHLLVFMYESDSRFKVFVFDDTTIEIDYPSIPEQAKEEIKDDDENLETFPRPLPKPRSKPAFPCSQSSKRRKTNPEGTLNLCKKGRCSENNSQVLRLSVNEKVEALKRAGSFKSNHPYFMLPMQPSYVRRNYSLIVPRVFAESYLGSGKKDVILKALDGRTWSVKYTGFESKGSKPRFETGWRAFALANNLKRGDVCVFAMTKRKASILFEVSIFRENSASVPEKKNSRESGETASFTVRLQASYLNVKTNFYVPIKFAKTHIGYKIRKARLLISDGRSWSVIYKAKRNSVGRLRGEFCDGWREFARENGLKKGNICTFKLISRGEDDELVFRVSIVEAAHKPIDSHPNAKFKAIKSEEMSGDEADLH